MPMRSPIKTKPTPADALVAAVILLLAAALTVGLWSWNQSQSGALTAVVSVDGQETDRVVLSELSAQEERTYSHSGYTLTVVFSPEAVQVTHSDCPTQDCVHTGAISRGGQSIICLPARIVVRLEGSSSGDSDVDLTIG